MQAGPISVQFVPSLHGMGCPEGQTQPQCTCSGPLPPQSPHHLPELSWSARSKEHRHIKKCSWRVILWICSSWYEYFLCGYYVAVIALILVLTLTITASPLTPLFSQF